MVQYCTIHVVISERERKLKSTREQVNLESRHQYSTVSPTYNIFHILSDEAAGVVPARHAREANGAANAARPTKVNVLSFVAIPVRQSGMTKGSECQSCPQNKP